LNDSDTMEDLSLPEIELMDKILLLTIKNDYRQGAISEQLGISHDEFQFLVDRIVEFSRTQFKIVSIYDEGSSFQSIQSCFETERFLRAGGFEKHFANKRDKIRNKKPWYKRAWVIATTAIGVMASLATILEVSCNFWSNLGDTSTATTEPLEELVLYSKPMFISADKLDFDTYKNDTIDVEITAGSAVLLDSCFLKTVNYTDNGYLYRDPGINLKPKIAVLNYSINKKTLNKDQNKSRIIFVLDLDFIPFGDKVGRLEKGKIINLAELTYQIFYKQNGIIKSKEITNKIQLTRLS
jgi:hypothetical protein